MRNCGTRLMAALLLLGACDSGAGNDDDSETDTEPGTTGEPAVGWFEVGWGEYEFNQLVDGGELHIVWGSQGAAMYPMPIRGGEFSLAPDPMDWTDERTPYLDFELDVEGIEPG